MGAAEAVGASADIIVVFVWMNEGQTSGEGGQGRWPCDEYMYVSSTGSSVLPHWSRAEGLGLARWIASGSRTGSVYSFRATK